MKNYELFLSKYKELENIVSSNGYGTVLDYENNVLTGADKEYLKMCRIARNHIVHTDSNFFEPSKKMIAYIESLAHKIDIEKGVAKDIMMSFAKYGSLKLSDTLEAAINLISKKDLDNVLVLSDDNMECYIVPILDICKAIATASSYKRVKLQSIVKNMDYTSVTVDTPISKIPDEPFVFVVDNKGKYKGVIVTCCN